MSKLWMFIVFSLLLNATEIWALDFVGSDAIRSENDLKNEIWVANLFFSRCTSTCPALNQRLIEILSKSKFKAKIRIVSITTDPANDNQALLEEYGRRYRKKWTNWNFVTGSEEQVFDFIKNVIAVEGTGKPFVHSNRLVIFDRHLRRVGDYSILDSKAEKSILRALEDLYAGT